VSLSFQSTPSSARVCAMKYTGRHEAPSTHQSDPLLQKEALLQTVRARQHASSHAPPVTPKSNCTSKYRIHLVHAAQYDDAQRDVLASPNRASFDFNALHLRWHASWVRTTNKSPKPAQGQREAPVAYATGALVSYLNRVRHKPFPVNITWIFVPIPNIVVSELNHANRSAIRTINRQSVNQVTRVIRAIPTLAIRIGIGP